MSIKASRKDPVTNFLGLVVNKTVFLASIAVIIVAVGGTLVFQEQADYYFGIAQRYVSAHGGWVDTLGVKIFISFCLYMAFGEGGSFRVAGKRAKLEFHRTAWFARLIGT